MIPSAMELSSSAGRSTLRNLWLRGHPQTRTLQAGGTISSGSSLYTSASLNQTISSLPIAR